MLSQLRSKIKTLNESMWDRALPWSDVERWLSKFSEDDEEGYCEQTHALYLLSNFSYFNSSLMRVLLKSLFRDLIQYPILQEIRQKNGNSLDWTQLQPVYEEELKSIRFIGIGNPSESSTHLLYYFRQENDLPTNMFIHPHELFQNSGSGFKLSPGIKKLIFIDDFCGSGTQANRYSKGLLTTILSINDSIQLSYFPLFATSVGLDFVKRKSRFTEIATVCELDSSFHALRETSRYFREPIEGINREFALEMCKKYGERLEPGNPLGFKKGQLLLGFAHNIPNNSLPIFWSEGHDGSQNHIWDPVFRRSRKGKDW